MSAGDQFNYLLCMIHSEPDHVACYKCRRIHKLVVSLGNQLDYFDFPLACYTGVLGFPPGRQTCVHLVLKWTRLWDKIDDSKKAWVFNVPSSTRLQVPAFLHCITPQAIPE